MMIPKILYHGTASKHLVKIKKYGLRGRKPGTPGNFPDVPSGLGRVYLSDTFALWYAIDGRPKGALLEIDTESLDQTRWFPDEDWIASGGSGEADKRTRTKIARKFALAHPELAERSLLDHGTVAYAGIVPPCAITGVTIFSPKELTRLVMGGYDPVPGIGAHQILSERYRAFHAWAFGKTGGTVSTAIGPFTLPDWQPTGKEV